MVDINEGLDDKKDVDLETVLSRFRPLSQYYLRFMSLFIFTGVLNGMHSMNYIFAVDIVDYRCKYPECTTEAYSHLNSTIIEDKCHKYQLNPNGTCSAGDFNMSNVEYCKEWAYENPCSFVSSFQLGCRDVKRGMVATTHSIGYMMGLLILGPISDKFGRKKLIVVSGLIGAVMGLTKSFATSYWVYALSELTEAMFGDTYSPNYILGIEMVSKKNRVFFAPLMQAALSVGGVLLALAAWSLPCWRNFVKVVYAPALLYIVHAFFLDESVRWLLLKNRRAEAKTILAKATKLNKINIKDETLDRIKCEKTTTNNNLISTLKLTLTSRTLIRRFLACVFAWITVTFNKNSLLFIAVGLEGNKYVNFALSSFVGIPASIVIMFILIKFKRRKPLMLSFLATGAFCVIVAFMPKGYPLLSTSIFLLGKFMSMVASGTLYLYTSELFPTYTRNTMHGLCSSLGRIGSIVAPHTVLLIPYWSGLPTAIVGGLSLTSALIIKMMPDTAESTLPDTVEQAEALGIKELGTNSTPDSKSLL